MLYETLNLIRIRQWYKNLLVFLPLFFSKGIFTTNLLPYFIGFFLLCLTSSSYYILNDIKDIKKDKKNPEKRDNPIPLKKIKIKNALFFSIFLLLTSLLFSIKLGIGFLIMNLMMFLLTLSYILWFKKIIIVNLISVSMNYVIRIFAGGFIESKTFSLNIYISPWLILCVFFLALFLASVKKKSNLDFENHYLTSFKKNTKNQKIIKFIIYLSAILLLFTYILYSIFIQTKIFLISIPVASFCILRYIYLLKKNDKITRNPELFYKDGKLFIGVLIYLIIIFKLIYLT